MKIKKEQTRRISVHMESVDKDDVNDIAEMLRSLACALDGYNGVAGMTNEKFGKRNLWR